MRLTWVDVLLGEAKVDDVDDLVLLHGGAADEEVLRLDVPVDEVLGVHELQLVQQLDGQHQHRLQRELAPANVEQVLKRWPEQLEGSRRGNMILGRVFRPLPNRGAPSGHKTYYYRADSSSHFMCHRFHSRNGLAGWKSVTTEK